MTAFNSKDGGFFKTPVGRVQTPLAIVAEREERIRASCRATTGRCAPSSWPPPACTKAAGSTRTKKDERDPEKRESRLWSQAAAQSVVAACREQPGSVTEESKPSTQMSPALYDLTSLQREANGRFGFRPDHAGAGPDPVRTPQGADLPRTDSRYLPRTT